MKLYNKILIGFFVIAAVGCSKFEFMNPWDENSKLLASEWSPQIVSINEIDITSKEINIEVGDFEIEGFYLDRKVGNQPWVEKYKTLDANVRRFTDDDILPDTNLTYHYRISSFAGKQESLSAESQSQAQFNAPNQIAIQQVNEKEYIISWEDQSEGEEGFEIWKQKNNEAWYKLAILPPNTEVYVDTNAFVNKEDWEVNYKVSAFYQNYYSTEKTIGAEIGLLPPDSLVMNALNNVEVELAWESKNTTEDGFIIERKENNNDWHEIARTENTSFIDSDFIINSNLSYRISAYIGNYQTDYKEISYQSFIAAPTEFVINKNTNFSIDIEWTYQTLGHQGFRIDRMLNNEGWDIAYAEVGQAERVFTDNNVDIQNNDYTYRIYAYIDEDQSDYLERFLHIPEIGEYYAGGYVYYLDNNEGGMVVARIDSSPAAQWGCYGTWNEAIGEDVGDGLDNTLKFISNCDEDWRGAWYSYNWEHEGYDDWFMPSKESLQLIYEKIYLQGLGDFQDEGYWSSTEYTEYSAKYIYFATGNWNETGKASAYRIRSVRKF